MHIPSCKYSITLLLAVITFYVVGKENNVITGSDDMLRGNGMMFTQNKGQIIDADGNLRPDILYKGTAGGTDVYLRKTGFSYVLKHTEAVNDNEPEQGGIPFENVKAKNVLVKFHRIDADFEDCNIDIEVLSTDRVEGQNNYYYPHCPQGITHVNSYNVILLKNVYDNIDIKYYGGKSEGMKYDIVVLPGGNPSQIKMKYSGAGEIEIENGELRIKNSLNEITEILPKVYQNINGRIVDVKAKYILEGTTISFQLSTYNAQLPLVIDPWITYYGGSDWDRSASVATDMVGDVIVTGNTACNPFPLQGATQTIYGGGWDGLVVKFTNAGTRVFATYFGGNGVDFANGVCADNTNNIIVTGGTNSGNLPTLNLVGAYNQSFQGPLGGFATGDAFLAKFTPAGVLTWSTFYGGSDSDVGYDVFIDNANNIVMTGYTASNNFPILSAYQGVNNGQQDAFVVKFNSAGVRQWATYYGGNDRDGADAITTDAAGDICFGGFTWSANFPLLSAHQSVQGSPGTDGDGFIAKLSGATGFPVWSTYYGGNGFFGECVYAIAVDGLGNVYAGGRTSSTNNISTAGAFQLAKSGSYDAFLVKFNSSGVVQWGTYAGGGLGLQEYVTGIACDKNNNVVVVGDTYSSDFPTTSCAYQRTFAPSENQFFTVFYPSGGVMCSGMLGTAGGGDKETWEGLGGSVAIYGCDFFINAMSECKYPVTPGCFQNTCSGGLELSIAKLYIYTCGGITTTNLDFNGAPTVLCSGQSVNYTPSFIGCDTVGVKYNWTFAGGTPGTSTSINPSITYYTPGTYAAKLVVTTACNKDSLTKNNYITVNGPFVNIAGNNNICFGSSTSLTASGALSYIWNNSATTTAVTLNPTATTTYSVIGTDNNGCTNTSVTTVTVNSIPVITINGPASICNGNSVALSAAGGTNYLWNNNSTSISIIVSPTSITSYSVTGSSAAGCTAIAVATLSVNPLPVININGPSLVCSGGTVNLSASGGSSYVWSNSGTSSFISVSPTAATSYSVIGTDANGCTGIKTTSVTVNSLPLISINGPFSVCAGGSVNLTASGGNSYVWSTSGTSALIAGSPTSATSYSVIGADGNGCTGVGTASVSVNFSPFIFINGSSSICAGGSISLTATGGSSYQWSTTGTSSVITVSPTSATSYSVVGTDASGCTGIATSTVSINSPPVILINGPSSVCAGGSVNLTASGGSSYVWNNSGTSSLITISPTVATSYSVIGTDGNGCTGVATSSVSVNSSPLIIINGPSSICAGGSVSLTATGGNGYIWSTANTSASITVFPTGPTSYSVISTDVNGCTGIGTANVVVNSLPLISINGSSSICAGGSVNLTATGGNNYVWSTASTLSVITITPTSATSYSVVGTDANGCSNTGVFLVTVNSLPLVSFSADDSTGCSPVCVNFTNTTPNVLFASWNFGNGSTSGISPGVNHCYNVPGIYSVSLVVTDVNNCSAQISKNNLINVYPSPVAGFTVTPQSPVPINTPINLIDQSSGASNWQWSFGDVLNTFSSDQNPTFNYATNGNYVIQQVVRNSYGCSDTMELSIYVQEEFSLFIPNSFTPNGDGYNDVFSAKGAGIDEAEFEMWIFDRWGNLIWKTNRWNAAWDGRANDGKAMAQIDTYVWLIRLHDTSGIKHRYTGHVNLLK